MPDLTINGVIYPFPDVGDKPYAQAIINWATAVTGGMLQKAGGSFSLTADADFGASFGLKVAYLSTRAANPSASGIVRFANNDTALGFRNAANSADLVAKVNASDQFVFEDVDLQPLTTRGDIIYRDGSGQNVRLAIGSAGFVLKSDGTDILWGTVAGTGDVVGPASATDHAIARFDLTTGKLLQNCLVTVDDSGNMANVGTINGITLANVLKSLCPVGSIVPFYDFGSGGPGGSPLTFDGSYWAYCDGRSVTLNGAGSYATPDLSNRYLVGFGTEGGGDMDTATWATAAVGNASHQVDISHTHTGPSHTHTGPSHTHTGPSHTHSGPSHRHAVCTYESSTHKYFKFYFGTYGSTPGHGFGETSGNILAGGSSYPGVSEWNGGGNDGDEAYSDYAGTGNTGSGGTGNTGSGGTGATGASGTGATGSAGSATQTIQPRSIRVRFIMRIL